MARRPPTRHYGNLGDQRLETIHHTAPGGVTLSKFDYTYDADGRIRTWRQTLGANAPVMWEYGYDAADQLVAALKRTNDLQTVLRRHYYAYDAAGNRTAEQIDDNVVQYTYDNLNRLVAQQAGGPIRLGRRPNRRR